MPYRESLAALAGQEAADRAEELARRVASVPGRARLIAGWAGADGALVSLSLLELAHEQRFHAPARGLLLAGAALEVAEQLPPGPLAASLQAECLAERANAHRVLGRAAEAGDLIEEARRRLEGWEAEPLAVGIVAWVRGVLLGERGLIQDGLTELLAAEVAYRQAGDAYRCAQLMLSQSRVYAQLDQPTVAQRLTARALSSLAHGQRDPERLVLLVGLQNHALWCALAGRPRSARRQLSMIRGTYDELGPAGALKRQWLEGHILAAEGDYAAAGRLMLEAAEGFAGLGRSYHSATASLAAALAWIESGDWLSAGAALMLAAPLLLEQRSAFGPPAMALSQALGHGRKGIARRLVASISRPALAASLA